MLGGAGLAHSSKIALLNANYIAERLKDHYTIRYKNIKNRVAHELLIDLAEFDKLAGLKVPDFAKRLQVMSFMFARRPFFLRFRLTLVGLWFPPTHMFMAHLDCDANRTHRVRITCRTKQVCLLYFASADVNICIDSATQ